VEYLGIETKDRRCSRKLYCEVDRELNRQKIAARLKREGWTFRPGKKHDVFAHPAKPRTIIALPRHRTVSAGVARNTAKTAGWI
jgi:mRNA interferase HicA